MILFQIRKMPSGFNANIMKNLKKINRVFVLKYQHQHSRKILIKTNH